MPTLEELFDAIEKQEQDVYEAAGQDADRSVRRVYDELVEAEEELEQATAGDDAGAAEEAKQECEKLAGELLGFIEGLQVDLHNIAVDLDDLEAIVLEGYAVSDA